MYTWNGYDYSAEEVQQGALEANLELNEFLKKHSIAKSKSKEEDVRMFDKSGKGYRVPADEVEAFRARTGAVSLQEIQNIQAQDLKAKKEAAARANDPTSFENSTKDIKKWQDYDYLNTVLDQPNKKPTNKTLAGRAGLAEEDEVEIQNNFIPGSDEEKIYNNRLNKATGLAIERKNEIENNLGDLLNEDLQKGFFGRTLDETINNNFIEQDDGSFELSDDGMAILDLQYPEGITPAEREKIEADYKEIQAINQFFPTSMVEEYTVAEATGSILENFKAAQSNLTGATVQKDALIAEINKFEKDGVSKDDPKYISAQEKLAEANKKIEAAQLNRENFSTDEEYDLAKQYATLQEDKVKMLDLFNKIKGHDTAFKAGDPSDKGSGYLKPFKDLTKNEQVDLGMATYGIVGTTAQLEMDQMKEDYKRRFAQQMQQRDTTFIGENEEINELAAKYEISPEEITVAIRGGEASFNKLIKNSEKQIEDEYAKNMKELGFVRNSWDRDFSKAVRSDEKVEVLGQDVVKRKATEAAKNQAAAALGNIDRYENLNDTEQSEEVDNAYQAMIGKDPVVQNIIKNLTKDSIPLLNTYREQLVKDYDMKDEAQVIKANKLLSDKQHELTIGKLIEMDEFQQRSSEIGLALGEVTQEYDMKFAREDSGFLSALDWIRGGEDDFIPFNDSIADLAEGIVSASVGIGVSIGDKAKGSWHGNQFRRAEKKTNQLNNLLTEGYAADDKVKWNIKEGRYIKDSKGKTIQERLDGYKKSTSYHQSEIVEQIEDITASEEYLSAFKQANFDDGIGFEDIFLTVGNALPHIAMAAGGTALGLATGGGALAALAPIAQYAGTAMMGLQMYGDNYWSAIENNLQKRGLDKEGLRKKFPNATNAEIDRKWKDAAIENLESGEGANIAQAAAFAAAQTALETYGAQQMVKGTAKALVGKSGLKGLKLGSIYKTSWQDTGKWLLRGAIEKGENSLQEFGTEYMQEILGQVSTAVQGGQDATSLIDHSPAFQAGIGGAITGFMLPFSGSILKQTTSEIRNAAADLSLKYGDPTKPGFAKRAQLLNAWFEQSSEELKKKFPDRETNIEQKKEYYNQLGSLNSVRVANLKLQSVFGADQNYMSTMTDGNRKTLLDNYVDIELYDKSIRDADGNKPLQNALKEEQAGIIDNTSEIIKTERTTANVAKIMEKAGKGKELIVVDNEAQLRREAKKQNVALDSEGKTVGFFTNDGKIVVDKETAAQMKEGNTAAHELLHKVLFKTLYGVDGDGNIKGKNVARGLAAALDTELDRLDPTTIQDSKFKKKLELYKKNPAAIKAEEKITLFADAIESGDLKFDDGIFTKIGDQIRRFMQSIGLKDVKFNSGRDVYNFLKDYNASVKAGKLNQAQIKVMEKGAEVGSDIRRFQGTEGKLGTTTIAKENKAIQDSYEQTNKLLADEDFDIDNSLDQKRAVKQAAGVIEATTNRLWRKGSLLTRPQFVKALENEYVQSLTEYDAARDTGIGAGKSLSNKFNLRANAVAKENIGKGEAQSIDSKQARQVEDTTQEKDFDQKIDEGPKQRKKATVTNNPVIQEAVPPKARNQIKEIAKTTISTLANKGKSVEEIVKGLEEEATKNTWEDVKGKMTLAKKSYSNFINNLFNTGFVKNISVYDMKNRFKVGNKSLFGVKEIGKTPATSISPKTGKKGIYNKQVFSVIAPPTQTLKNYFLNGKTDAYRKRAKSLFQLIAKDIELESLPELKGDTDFMNNLTTILKDQNSPLTAEQFIDAIDQKLDRRNLEDTSLDKVKANKALKSDKVEQAKSYVARGMAADARSDIKDMTKKPLYIRKGKTLSKADQKRRKVGTIVAYHKLGPKFYTGNTLYGSTQYSVYQTEVEADADLNSPLDADTIKQFKEEGIPTEVRKDGKTYYDKSKANNVDITFTDKEGNEIVHEKGGSMTTSQNKGKAISTLEEAQKEQMGSKRKDGKGGAYKNWNMKELMRHVMDPNWRQLQINKLKVLKNIAKTIAADIKANPERTAYWAAWLGSQSSQSSHPIRTLAPIKFFSRIMHSPKLGFVAEHTLPANQVASMILGMAKRDTVNRDFKDIEKDYYQGKITKKQDNLLKGEGYNYTSNMPQIFFDLLNPSTWLRYLDKSVNARQGGINTNQILVWDKDGKVQTLAESFGVGLTPSQYNMPNGKVNQNLIQEQNNMLYDMFVEGEPTAKTIKERLTADYNLKTQRAKTNRVAANSKDLAPTILNSNDTTTAQKQTMLNSQETAVKANKVLKESKGISVFDFDDTLAKTKEKVIVYAPAFKPGTSQEVSMKLTPAEFAEQAQDLEAKGASFDFSQFEDVKGAKKGPLADLALKRQGKFGSGDIFVLTARPQTSALGIKTFLDGIGLNIPIENVTGLEDGTPQAKADWVLAKTAKGYNDFYFADDSKMNVAAVKQVLDQVDVKSKVQIAKANKVVSLDKEFNKQIEEVTGKEAVKEYSKSRAKLEGKAKDKGFFKWLGKQLTITPSAEDFMGIMYDLIGVGKQGNKHAKFISDNLMKPFNKAEQAILSAKVTVANDFAALKKKFPSLKSKRGKNPLMQEIGVGPYTKSHAIRVYTWAKQGMDIPGLSKRDQNALIKAVEADNELNVFADEMILIQKDSQYPPPGKNWTGGDITSDILQGLDKGFRQKAMTEFNENVDIIFSEKNLNKLEAIYGTKWVEALQDSLRRMKSGSNRPVYQGGGSRIVNEMLDWLNGSVGAVMFLNMKSGLLQLISNVNFVNWGDNNMYQAAKAFASKEYWPTVMKLMNSDYLVNRRDGLKINVNEAELADAANKGGMKGAIAYMLDKGFIITRIMDSLAIATGGATFYINRTKALLQRQNPETGKKYTQVEAEAQAFADFYAISEESQQSSNPSKISQQQASLAGRVILSFQNVTMQYNRKVKKSIRNLWNRRKNPGQTQRESDMGNLSQIIYYTTIQNVIFNGLQQALFAGLFDDEEDEKEKNKTAAVANGMLDSLLFGLGFGGAAISTVKNVVLKVMEEGRQKSPDYEEAVWEIFNISPVIDSKVRKLRTTARSFSWNMEEIKKRGWSLDNPAYLAISQLISATTNIPIDRVLRKTMNLRAAMDEETRAWQTAALILGWSTWSVGLPYWGLQSTIKKEDAEKAKVKASYKTDVRKIKAMGYKKVMSRVLKDYDPKDIIELRSPAGTVVYYAKVGAGKKAKN